MTSADNNPRPASFDARVMAYLPGLKNLSRKYAPPKYRYDLVTDTIIYALGNWQNFREDGGMWNWLAWTMRGIAKNEACKAASAKSRAVMLPIEDFEHLSTPPNQEEYTDLSIVLGKVSGLLNGEVLLRRAMGEHLQEIGNDRGVTRERIRQLEVDARERLKAA